MGIPSRARGRTVSRYSQRSCQYSGASIRSGRHGEAGDRSILRRDEHRRPGDPAPRPDRVRALRQRDDDREPSHPHVGVEITARAARRRARRSRCSRPRPPRDGRDPRSCRDGLQGCDDPPAPRHASGHRLRRGLPGDLGSDHRVPEGGQLEPAQARRHPRRSTIFLPGDDEISRAARRALQLCLAEHGSPWLGHRTRDRRALCRLDERADLEAHGRRPQRLHHGRSPGRAAMRRRRVHDRPRSRARRSTDGAGRGARQRADHSGELDRRHHTQR